MSNLLIIGGSGFFGHSFIDYFNKHSLLRWGIKNIFITSRSVKLISGHRTIIFDSNQKLKKISDLPEPDYIIYAASSTSEDVYKHSFDKELIHQENNMKYFLSYVNSLKKIPKKILYTSSGAVYGQSNLNNKLTNEIDTQCDPDDNNDLKKVYANIKISWEKFMFKNFYDISVIARCFAFVGPRLPLNKHFVIGNIIDDYLHNRSINVRAKNKVYRSYMYSDDLVEWLLTMLTSTQDLNNKIYNVGSDEEIEIHDMANVFNQLSNNQKKVYQFDDSITDRYIPTIDFARETFNLNLKFNLMQSIRSTLDHIKKENCHN